MIALFRKSERSDQKTPGIKRQLYKVAGHKVNIQKSIAFLYTINEQFKFEIINTVSLILTKKKKEKPEIFRYKSFKNVQDL